MELLETVIVDDGSTDRTRELLREAPVTKLKVRPLLDCAENRGKGSAVARGVAAAHGDYVLIADVDLSTPLEELGKLTAAMRAGADLAIGSRAVAGAVVKRGPRHRKLLGAVFNRAVRLLTGLNVHDTQCGFKLMRTAVGRRLLAHQTCPGFAFDVELLIRADLTGLTIAEVPVLYLHDHRSKVRVGAASLQMLRDVCGLAYRLRVRADRGQEAGRLVAEPSADDSD